jgi:alginate O-acetyltransferase complex protein AlgI
MLFSSPIFLFLFLPVFLLLCFFQFKPARNLLLVIFSLMFYAWGDPKYVLVLIASILVNYLCSYLVDKARKNEKPAGAGIWLGLAIAFNLGLLIGFKYINFLVNSGNTVLSFSGLTSWHIAIPTIPIPLGVSFFTFSAVSYLVDIYRKEALFERNPLNVALYISFFPKLLAGPIVQYRHFQDQIKSRTITGEKAAYGIQRFILGLGKKVLIANTLGTVADQVFALPSGQLTAATAWLGIACYTLQIYFDFSGYSDMAIGLGRMAGFEFLENFNYPYISRSIQEFWRRWHISLSSWFRDYLYIPLGGNRRGPARVYFNLIIVFLLCGLWHGAGKAFVVWGAWHGLFIVLEHAGLGNRLKKFWPPVSHLYLLLVVMIGWVLFRAESLHQAADFLKVMAGLNPGKAGLYSVMSYLDNLTILTLAAAMVLSTPVFPAILRLKDKLAGAIPVERQRGKGIFELGYSSVKIIALGLVLVLSMMSLSGSLNNPFIYFKF